MEISIVIPMYNAEKYIGACLNSLIDQTFQDFEVIVVDDCSTDNSVAIVESYAEKFGDRLKISRTKKNSGGGGYVPRNIGLGLSRGEYVYFLDADDFLVKIALEILHTAAKSYDADVVYTSKYYSYADADNLSMISDDVGLIASVNGVKEQPTVIEDADENLRRSLLEGEFRNPWTKFVRRELLIENEIKFPKIKSGGDFIWTIQVYCHAKKFLRLPVALYFYRADSAESISRKNRSPAEQVAYWVSAFIAWFKSLDALSEETEILSQNPVYCWQAARLHLIYCLNCCGAARKRLGSSEIYEILAHELPEDLTVPFLFSILDEQGKILTSKVNE